MTRIILVTCILATMTMLASCEHHKHAEDQTKAPASSPNSQAPAPSSSDDCMTIVYDLEDCLSYLLLDLNAEPEPTKTCCPSFKRVAKIAGCLCLAIKGVEDYGLFLNRTRVKGLPGICKFPAGSQVVASCLASLVPGASPPGNNPPSSSPELPPPKKSPELPPPPKKSPEPSAPSKSPPEEAPTAPKASPSQNHGSPSAENGGGKVITAPAPAPGNGGAHPTPASIMALISLLLASFSLALV